jgi:hypothetical protein
MDIKQKKKVLTYLAQKAEPGSLELQAIKKECTKITVALEKEIQYDHIAEQLELLDAIAHRVADNAVSAIDKLLTRLETLKFNHQGKSESSDDWIRKYKSNYTLMVKALEVLQHIRYHQIEDILNIFFKYSCHEEESVAKQAKQGIEKLAEYNLDIFYGDGKEWQGLGTMPQDEVLKKIESFNDKQKQNNNTAIIIASNQMLSPTLSGTSSTYKTVTWRTAVIPASDDIKSIRKRMLNILEHIYGLAIDIKEKKAILNAMEAATRTPDRVTYGDDVQAMIIENTISVLKFMQEIASSIDLQIMQKVEHDAYWLFYHMGSLDENIHQLALEIRDTLYANEEYKRFRILIGFESIFHDWEKGRGSDNKDLDQESSAREKETLKLAESINEDSYEEWKERIICYTNIKSDDLATFPYFGNFLRHFGRISPNLALQFLSDSSDQVEKFIVPILCGIAETEDKENAYEKINHWCDQEKYLFSLAQFFEFSTEINESLFLKILNKAIEVASVDTLNQIIVSVTAQYTKNKKPLIQQFFIPALEELTKHKNTDWVFGFWFRKQRDAILSDMNIDEHKVILDNLLWLDEIDYHAEEILYVIAEQSPELVIHFFCKRLSKQKDKERGNKYQAVPFSFHKLSEPLSKCPVPAVNAALDVYKSDDDLSSRHVTVLLKNIFTNFPSDFQKKLLDVAQSDQEINILFVMDILKKYEGDSVIHGICKELVKLLPMDTHYEGMLLGIMQSCGVVSGEYGFVEAYQKKIEEIKPWLHDENDKVTKFAEDYTKSLTKRIEDEKKRADEEIALRKYQFRVDDE